MLALLTLGLVATALAAFLLGPTAARAPAHPQAPPRRDVAAAPLRPRPRAARRAARPPAAALVRQRSGVGDVPRPRLHPRRWTPAARHAGRRGRPGAVRLPDLSRTSRSSPTSRAAASCSASTASRSRTSPGRPHAPAGIRRRARQVDGAHLRRGARDRPRQHAPRRPPARPRPRPARHLAAGRVGARSAPATSEHEPREQRPPRAQPGPTRRPGPGRRARLPEGHRPRRRVAEPPDHRHRQHLDRGDAVQLPSAPARREGQGRRPAPPAARRWSSTRSRSPTASRWAPRG